MEKKEKIICPICEGSSSYCFKKEHYKIYKCAGCDLRFVWPIPENLSEVYKQDYFYKNNNESGFGYVKYDEDKEPMHQIFVSKLVELEKLVKEKKVFDIGCATGYFLDIAKKRGWKTMGSEISDYGFQEGRKRGHKIYQSQLEKVEDGIKVNLVTMWDVLEHVDDPKKYIKEVNNILVGNGYLLINTIDVDSWWARLWGKKWNMIIPPEHLFYFSSKSIKILLEKNGFEIIKKEKLAKKFSLSYIFKILYEWQGLFIWKYFTKFFNTKFWRIIKIPINVRDNIFILAKKKENV